MEYCIMAKHVWDICNGKEALWVKWINTIRLKGVSFWGINKRSVDSWIWRKMLALRGILKPHVKYIVEDGRSVLGLLLTYFVAEFFGKMKWSRGRMLTDGVLRCKNIMPKGLSDVEGSIVWLGNTKHQIFKITHERETEELGDN
ncbi:hypothetical protein LIER_07641 [Lithospermum erythrorhizon]|uniref:Uncharacterized protein n=1 Tax=Lithospermum erythrorhizon TaxID=34254 RepID=A0AAV3PAN8_LITER